VASTVPTGVGSVVVPPSPAAGAGAVAKVVAVPWFAAGGDTGDSASKYSTAVSTSTGPVAGSVPLVKELKLSPPPTRKEFATTRYSAAGSMAVPFRVMVAGSTRCP
jgi:hypothetical protein